MYLCHTNASEFSESKKFFLNTASALVSTGAIAILVFWMTNFSINDIKIDYASDEAVQVHKKLRSLERYDNMESEIINNVQLEIRNLTACITEIRTSYNVFFSKNANIAEYAPGKTKISETDLYIYSELFRKANSVRLRLKANLAPYPNAQNLAMKALDPLFCNSRATVLNNEDKKIELIDARHNGYGRCTINHLAYLEIQQGNSVSSNYFYFMNGDQYYSKLPHTKIKTDPDAEKNHQGIIEKCKLQLPSGILTSMAQVAEQISEELKTPDADDKPKIYSGNLNNYRDKFLEELDLRLRNSVVSLNSLANQIPDLIQNPPPSSFSSPNGIAP